MITRLFVEKDGRRVAIFKDVDERIAPEYTIRECRYTRSVWTPEGKMIGRRVAKQDWNDLLYYIRKVQLSLRKDYVGPFRDEEFSLSPGELRTTFKKNWDDKDCCGFHRSPLSAVAETTEPPAITGVESNESIDSFILKFRAA